MVLPANFRVDAWVTPPAYTGKPPVILAGMHPGEMSKLDSEANGPMSVPVGSTLMVRATGKLDLDVAGKGGVTPVTEKVQAPAGTQEYRFKIAATGAATLHGVGEDLTWAFNVIPDKPPTIALARDPEQQVRGSLLLSYRLEDDYGVTEARATLRARLNRGEKRGDASAVWRARFRAGLAAGAHQERRRPDHQGSDRSSLGRRRSGDDAGRARRSR